MIFKPPPRRDGDVLLFVCLFVSPGTLMAAGAYRVGLSGRSSLCYCREDRSVVSSGSVFFGR